MLAGEKNKIPERLRKHVMISYSWDNNDQVKQIIDCIKPFIHVWRDKNNLAGAGDLWTEIADAVTQSEFVIAVLTPDYNKSDNCTNELNFALNSNIPVVPVFIDSNFRPTGNVGLRTSKLFYLLMKDILQNPLLFIKHLYAMSYKLKRAPAEIHEYSAPCFKFTMAEIEAMIDNTNKKSSQNNSYNSDFNNNNTNLKISIPKNLRMSDLDRTKNDDVSINPAFISTDSESDNQSNNSSLNVYCMQSRINGKIVNFTDVSVPYKLGDCMYLKNDLNKSKDEIKNVENKLNNLGVSPKKKRDSSVESRTSDSSAKHSFQIHQNKPDHSQYDLYSREKDELMSFICQGKEADIEDADYQEVYELKPKSIGSEIMMELVIHLTNDYFSCFSLIKDDLILAGSEKGGFHLIRPMKEKWDFSRFSLRPKFKGDDAEHYKKGEKMLIDMCYDGKGSLILLNRWKFNNDEIFKYTIESYSFNCKIADTVIYIETLCCFSNERPSEKKNSLQNPICHTDFQILNKSMEKSDKHPVFTRIYNDEKNNSIILIDSANSKIYWFKKSTGNKRRCLKSQDNSLKDPRALAMSYDEKEAETIYICSSGGVVAFNKNFNIKHDTLVSIQDIYYDSFEKCLLFIDKRTLFGGKIAQKNQSSQTLDKTANTDLRYKRLHSNIDSSKPNFSRLISAKNYVFVLSDHKKDFKSSIFAIDKSRLQPSNS